jgi:hypothetical protein
MAGLMVAGAGCSSGTPVTIELSLRPSAAFDTFRFQASAVAVDEAAVCDSGTTTVRRIESTEGDIIAEESGSAMVDRARADGGILEWYSVQEFVCTDGSGAFTITTYVQSEFAKSETEQDIPTWEIENAGRDERARVAAPPARSMSRVPAV